MTKKHTWKDWYTVRASSEADVLRRAKDAASLDHPDTPQSAMMTPQVRRFDRPEAGVDVLVIGKPA